MQTINDLKIPYNKVLARLGFASGKTVIDPKTTAALEQEILIAKKIIVPKQAIAFSAFKIIADDIILIEPSFEIKSKDIANLLANCHLVYGFAVTIGTALEEKRNAYINEKETSHALMLDAIGSVAAEELAEITNQQIKTEAELVGNLTTMRFSPGYGNWPLNAQKDFLNWIGAQAVGIKLTPSFQMLPEKSVSAILGIYKRQAEEISLRFAPRDDK